MEQNLDEQPQRVSLWSRIVKLPPAIKIAGSFVILILLGALLLSLPICGRDGGLSFLDALFTSTSAVCVTGLSVVTIADTFNVFGQVVILLLIQFGGLGFMLAMVVMSGMREKINHLPLPKALRGFPITMVTAAFIAMAFYVFTLVKVGG